MSGKMKYLLDNKIPTEIIYLFKTIDNFVQ